MAKMMIVERCGNCRHCTKGVEPWATGSVGHQRFQRDVVVARCDLLFSKRVDPDKLPPDCPLVDLNKVLEDVKAANPYDGEHDKSYPTAYQEGAEDMAKALASDGK